MTEPIPSRATLLERAASMRRNPTEPERLLWRALSNSQLGGHKFRRQSLIGGRIVDFYCPAKALAVEIDGDTHEADQDAARDQRLLREHGVAVLRFGNADVMHNLEGVLERLLVSLNALPDRWCGGATSAPEEERV